MQPTDRGLLIRSAVEINGSTKMISHRFNGLAAARTRYRAIIRPMIGRTESALLVPMACERGGWRLNKVLLPGSGMTILVRIGYSSRCMQMRWADGQQVILR